MSNLTAFNFIQERSEATPGLWNAIFSQLSENIATLDFTSGGTTSISSGLSVGNDLWVKGQIISGQNASITTQTLLSLGTNSNVADYIRFSDTSASRSNYVLGSHIGGTADGLNLWDESGSTMIVSFSKQSVRFFAPVLGPAIDTGGQAFSVRGYGALGDGVQDDSSAVQAAIDAVPPVGGAVLFPAGIYSVSTTIRIPTDRVVTLFGTGGFASNQSGYISEGCVIRATSALSGSTMFSQSTTGSAAIFGVQINGLCFDGNNQTVDLLALNHIAQVWIDNCVFFNSNGHGIAGTGLQNSSIALTRFFDLGNNVASPNGKVALGLYSDMTVGTNTVFVTSCHWESGRGGYIGSYDQSGVLPVDLVSITGGKMEFSPPHSDNVTQPLVLVDRSSDWDVNGLMIINSTNTLAVHLRVQNTVNSRFRTFHLCASSLTSAQQPQYYVDALSGSNLYFSGTYIRGAAQGGAHIRIVESSVNSYMIDPANVYVAPLSGINVQLTNPVAGTAIPVRPFGQMLPQRSDTSSAAPVYGFGSEISLGLYRSGQSAFGPSYGQFQLPSGSGVQPSLAFSSESSLGLYRSGASTIAFSYGSILIPLLGTGDRIGIGQSSGNPGFKIQHNHPSTSTFANAAADFAVMWTGPSVAGNPNFLGISSQTITPKAFLVTNASYGFSVAINGTERWSVNSLGREVTNLAAYTAAGSTQTPTWAFSSETSLGFFRSGASAIGQSYGTLNLAAGSAHLWASGISIGNATAGGSLIPAISSISSLVAAFVVQGSASSFTIITWAAAQPGDQILTTVMQSGAVSSLSSGLVLHSHCTQAGQIEFRLSNVSTLQQNQSSRTYFFTRITPF